MKTLIPIIVLFLPMIAHAVPQLEWQWISSSQSSNCSKKLVRTTSPEGMHSSDYSLLVVYTWKLDEPCMADSKTKEQDAIALWETKMDDLLASSNIGFSMATIAESNQLEYYYYVSDLDAFRSLSYQAGELLIEADVDYHFSRDLKWTEWQKLQSENAAQLYLALTGEEEE